MKKILIIGVIIYMLFNFSCFARHNKTISCINFSSINNEVSYNISTSRELRDRIKRAQRGDKLILQDDIAMNVPLYIEVPLTIDLNGHDIVFMSCETGINVETESTEGEIGFVSLLNGKVFMQNDGDYAIDVRKGNMYMNKMAVFGMNGKDGVLFGGNGGVALYIENTENMVILDSVVLVGGNSGIGRIKYGRTGDSIFGNTRKLISVGDGFHFRYNDIIGYVASDTIIKNK